MSADRNADQDTTPVDDVDWSAIERDPDYRRLRGMERRYVVPASVVALGFYLVFLVMSVSGVQALTVRLFGGFNVAYALMLVVFLLVWAAVIGYVLMANRRWDAQVERVARKAGVGRPDDGPTETREER